MTFYELVEQVRALLQREGRVSYRALKREFGLDDEYIEDLKAELIDAKQVAHDEDGKVLVWTGASPVSGSTFHVQERQKAKSKRQKFLTPNPQHLTPSTQTEMEQEAEGYFLKAIAVAKKQQARSLELRAVMSLSRL